MKLLIVGLLINIASWIFSWSRVGHIYQYMFFPLWFGYILAINGFSQILLGKSLLKKLGYKFILLFIISIPFWWFFEYLDKLTQAKDWIYQFQGTITPLRFYIEGSFDFSTVIPAVLSTSYIFYHSLQKIKKFIWKRIKLTINTLFILFELGILSILLIYLLPKIAFPLMWLGIILIMDPINFRLGYPSLIGQIQKGKWNLIISIAAAALFCGFLWEMWNFYSLPKWVYHVPYVGYFKIFEMPILGYLGYLFFGLEIYTYSSFVFSIGKINKNRTTGKDNLFE